jgi:hypothetical protein
MEMHEALSAKSAKMKKPMLRGIMLKKSDNGGVVAEHQMSGGSWESKEPMHTFAAGEGEKLAAHITEHLGMPMPGKMAEAEEEE